MRKLLLGLFLVAQTAAAFAQGTIIFDNHVAGIIVTHVYAPLPSNQTFHQTGNGSGDTPGGAQDWTGFSMIGANGGTGQYGGSTTFAQLLGAIAYNQPESSLQPALPTTTFRTGSFAGFIPASTATFANLPQNFVGATMEMVAWDNSSSLYPTWAQASVAWQAGLIAAGESGRWNQDNPPDPAPNLINSSDPSQHVASFNLYFIPEPSIFALVGLSAGMLVLWYRKGNQRQNTESF